MLSSGSWVIFSRAFSRSSRCNSEVFSSLSVFSSTVQIIPCPDFCRLFLNLRYASLPRCWTSLISALFLSFVSRSSYSNHEVIFLSLITKGSCYICLDILWFQYAVYIRIVCWKQTCIKQWELNIVHYFLHFTNFFKIILYTDKNGNRLQQFSFTYLFCLSKYGINDLSRKQHGNI